MDEFDQALELELCSRDPKYFINTFCYLFDGLSSAWIPFKLWDFQASMLDRLHAHQYNIRLKPRQIGATWTEAVAYNLWGMMFRPIWHSLLFSMRATEAADLISENKTRGMYKRLPDWMIKARNAETAIDNVDHWQLANGSSARAFAGGSGDSYTASYAVIDEADLIDNLQDTISRVMPTIEASGKLLMLSRINKKKPNSTFRQIWKAARLGENEYDAIFLPWHVHPLRDTAWYEAKQRNTTSQDELWEQYPATEQEALAMGYAGLVYPNFSMEENVSELADYDPAYPVEWWLDAGYTNPTAVLFVQWRPFDGQPDRICIFDVLYIHQTLPRTILLKSLAMPHDVPSHLFRSHDDYRQWRSTLSNLYNDPEVFVYDSAAPTFAAEFNAIRTEQDLDTVVKGSYKNIDENIKNARNYIGDEYNARLLQVHPRCKVVIEEIMAYHYKDSGTQTGGDYRPVPEGNHAMNAMEYGLAQRIYRIKDDD